MMAQTRGCYDVTIRVTAVTLIAIIMIAQTRADAVLLLL
jgi:hypothetical protein